MSAKTIIAEAFDIHMREHTTTADFEACKNILCQLASIAEEELEALRAEIARKDAEIERLNNRIVYDP